MKPRNGRSDGAPSLVVISQPNVSFSSPSQIVPKEVTIDLSKNSPINYSAPITTVPQNVNHTIVKPLQIPNGAIVSTSTPHNNITLYNIDESQSSLNLSTESSGYLSNSTNSSMVNISFSHTNVPHDEPSESSSQQQVDQLQQEVQRIQQQVAFNPVQLPTSTISGRRRTISSNSNG